MVLEVNLLIMLFCDSQPFALHKLIRISNVLLVVKCYNIYILYIHKYKYIYLYIQYICITTYNFYKFIKLNPIFLSHTLKIKHMIVLNAN